MKAFSKVHKSNAVFVAARVIMMLAGSISAFAVHPGQVARGNYSTVDVPEADNTEAFGINDAGSISGFYYANLGEHYGFTYTDGAFHEVVVPGAVDPMLFRIKNNGNVVGIVVDGSL
jgi:hypothetical protein